MQHDQWRVNRGYMINISKYPNSWMHGEKQVNISPCIPSLTATTKGEDTTILSRIQAFTPTRSYKQQHSLCRCLCIRLHLQALLGKEAANLWLALITKSMMVSTSLVLGAEAHTAGSCRTKATDWQEASTQNLRHSKAPGKSYKQYLVMCPDVFTHPSWTC